MPQQPRQSNWHKSERRSQLPVNWDSIRRKVLKRDHYKCQWKMTYGGICGYLASDVDHIIPGDNHHLSNLRSLCKKHHSRKSSQEGAAAAKAKRLEISQRFKRVEDHPGLI